MTFDLEISLKEFELKSGTIELRKFLNHVGELIQFMLKL